MIHEKKPVSTEAEMLELLQGVELEEIEKSWGDTVLLDMEARLIFVAECLSLSPSPHKGGPAGSFLVMTIPDGRPFWHDLSTCDLSIGSERDNGLTLSGEGVSRQHAEIFQGDDGKPAVRDLDSTNGTFLNGQLIPCSDLVDGDIITIGPHHLIFFD